MKKPDMPDPCRSAQGGMTPKLGGWQLLGTQGSGLTQGTERLVFGRPTLGSTVELFILPIPSSETFFLKPAGASFGEEIREISGMVAFVGVGEADLISSAVRFFKVFPSFAVVSP